MLLGRTGINSLRDLCLPFSCEEWHEISWLLRIFSLFSVFHCPNGCFHNGECVGAVCFCYQGWTGEDCSKFHCHDLHNCSGNGECMGPNVCKCYPGYLVGLLLFCIAVRRGNNAGNIYKFLCRFKQASGDYVKYQLQFNDFRNTRKYLWQRKFEFKPVIN